MSRAKPGRASINEGIQADSVRADVIAVGRGARASKRTGDTSREVTIAVDQLRSAVEALNLPPHAQAAIHDDLRALHAVAESGAAEPERAGHALQGIAGKLKMIGVVISEVVALSEPVRKIAELLRIPLQMVGLG
jgi:hypothetical protein